MPSAIDTFETIAATWVRRRADIERVSAPVRAWLVRELAARPGDTILELAAGTGDTGFEVAAIVGPTGRLISTDGSAIMNDAARARAAEVGVTNAEFRVVDAERIDLDDDSVDGVLCRFGYMLMDDTAAALAETRRVLRPGGRVALAVWGAPERNPFFATIGMALGKGGHVGPPPPGGPPIFSMASAQHTVSLLGDAGFADVHTEEVPVVFETPDADEYVAMAADTGGPIALVLRGLSDADRASVTADVAAGLAPFATDAGYAIPGVALCAVAS